MSRVKGGPHPRRSPHPPGPLLPTSLVPRASLGEGGVRGGGGFLPSPHPEGTRTEERAGERAAHAHALSLGLINVYFLEQPDGSWALVDTGTRLHFSAIVREAQRRYGNAAPSGIYLTHGHYDHAGSAAALAAYWNVPIFAHEAELPFLIGQCDYPPADPGACGGWLSLASRLGNTHGVDLRPFVQPLTAGPDGWEVIPLPGHTFGQVGFWHAETKTLIGGDALMNVRLDTWRPRPMLTWPPPPFTMDWFETRKSLDRILALRPQTLLLGHGKPLSAEALGEQLEEMTKYFAIARKGRYVAEPVRQDRAGRPIVAPVPPDPAKKLVKLAALGALATGAYFLFKRSSDR